MPCAFSSHVPQGSQVQAPACPNNSLRLSEIISTDSLNCLSWQLSVIHSLKCVRYLELRQISQHVSISIADGSGRGPGVLSNLSLNPNLYNNTYMCEAQLALCARVRSIDNMTVMFNILFLELITGRCPTS